MEPPLISRKQEILAAFVCQNSGNCCRCPGYVYVTRQECAEMATLQGMTEEDFRAAYVRRVNGWDVIASPDFRKDCFLDGENRCRVYAARPRACRSYPDWPDLWTSDEVLRREAQSCPGLRQALAKVTDSQ